MAERSKNGFFKARAKAIKLICLAAMLIIPFGLYSAARAGCGIGTYVFLGMMGLTMALAIKAG